MNDAMQGGAVPEPTAEELSAGLFRLYDELNCPGYPQVDAAEFGHVVYSAARFLFKLAEREARP